MKEYILVFTQLVYFNSTISSHYTYLHISDQSRIIHKEAVLYVHCRRAREIARVSCSATAMQSFVQSQSCQVSRFTRESPGFRADLQVSRWVLKISRIPLKWSFMHGFCIYALKKYNLRKYCLFFRKKNFSEVVGHNPKTMN